MSHLSDKEQIELLRAAFEKVKGNLADDFKCFSIIEQALAATAPSAQGQEKVDELPSSEFEAFQAWHVRYGPGFRKYSRLNEHEQRIAWQAWQARAALRSE